MLFVLFLYRGPRVRYLICQNPHKIKIYYYYIIIIAELNVCEQRKALSTLAFRLSACLLFFSDVLVAFFILI